MTLAARLAVSKPRLFRDYLRAYRVGRASVAEPSRLSPTPAAIGLDQFVARLPAAAVGPAIAQVRECAQPQTGRSFAALDADPALGELVYALVRSSRPRVVLETGVASGVTSAYALAALEDNAEGILHSVDLPPLKLRAVGGVGARVPPELRERWVYHWGDSRRLLPAVLEQLDDPLAVFVHDSEHGYESMRWELEIAADALEPGGWLVADDAGHHTAVADVAAGLGVEPLYVVQPQKAGLTGLIRKAG